MPKTKAPPLGVSEEVLRSVRARPGMWVGDVRGPSGTLQLAWELLGNAVDQHLAGKLRRVDVTLHADGSLSVADDGPGIPCTPGHTDFFDAIFTQYRDTPTADGHRPHVHLAQRGIGLMAVNALAAWLVVENHHGGRRWVRRFERGMLVDRVEGERTEQTGLRVTVRPDTSILGHPFDAARLRGRLRQLATLLPGSTWSFQDAQRVVFHAPSGVRAMLEAHVLERDGASLDLAAEIHETRGTAGIDIAWGCVPRGWSDSSRRDVLSFVNLERAVGEALCDGLVDGLAKGLGVRRDRLRSLRAVVAVTLLDPTFAAPTRHILIRPDLRREIRTLATGSARAWAAAHPEAAARWVGAPSAPQRPPRDARKKRPTT